MQRNWTRASTISVAGTFWGTLGLLLATAAPVFAESTATCDYVASTHKVKVTISGSGNTNVYENGSGQIWVNSAWCENKATVTNTDRITILAGVGNQEVNLFGTGAASNQVRRTSRATPMRSRSPSHLRAATTASLCRRATLRTRSGSASHLALVLSA